MNFMISTQINFRIPADLKRVAMAKADRMGSNLNSIINLFLQKFVTDDDLVEIKKEIRMDKIFDRGVRSAYSDPKFNKKLKRLVDLIESNGHS